MKIILITEGNKNIGMGHVSRCMSLYQAFEERKLYPCFIVNCDSSVKHFLKEKKFLCFNWSEKKRKLMKEVSDSDIIIVDSYLMEQSLYDRISEKSRIIVSIDDFSRLDYHSGVVINALINAKKISYPNYSHVKYLLGTEYSMLKKSFWDVSPKKIKDKINTIMISFGGSDARNLTPKVINMLSEKFPNIKKMVIIGKGFKNISKIKKNVDETCNLIYFPDGNKVKEIMLQSDVAITAGGQTVYELASVRVPAITIAVAENQIESVKECSNRGVNFYAGWWEDENIFDNLVLCIKKIKNLAIREKMVETGLALIKPDGSRKIVDYLVKLMK